MKIKCDFCGSMMNDTVERCPNCGAPNPNVPRSSGDQPLTIQQLRQWYEAKGLPPYSVTRFFIGENCTEPRVFGVYYEEETGNYIVYKNKASGERAVRYRGTDEAYAVNELFQRLKQEITQQKMHNAQKGAQPSGGAGERKSSGCLGNFVTLLALGGGIVAAILAALVLLGLFLGRNDPRAGYYRYGDTGYYYSDRDYGGLNWFRFDASENTWQGPLFLSDVPDALETRKEGEEYYLAEKWSEDISCADFGESIFARDLDSGMTVAQGYYRSGSDLFYHLPDAYDAGWYAYGEQWRAADFASLPEALMHPSTAKDCFLSETYQGRLGASDFSDTLFYRDYNAPRSIDRGYYQVDDFILYHLGERYDEGWYAYDPYEDDWSSAEMDALPEALHHPSLAGDFYFTPTWDASTQFSDFEDTDTYREASSQWNNDDDSSFNWDSNDSWDSGDTDWDSDW